MSCENLRAAIDIGTVTCRLLVARRAGTGACAGSLEELAHGYKITNLGEGVDRTGELLPAAIKRVCAAVDEFLVTCDSVAQGKFPRENIFVMATSAARDAQNAAEFEAALAARGLRLQVISGLEEARLTFVGATGAHAGKRVCVCDVGGGSTEISIGLAGQTVDVSHSFDVGCRRATERFLKSDPPAAPEIAAVRTWVSGQLESWFKAACAQAGAGAVVFDKLIAVAGTATTVVSVRESMRVYDSARVDGAVVTAADLQTTLERLAELPLAQRKQVVGLDPGRAPVMVAGLIILQEVLRAFNLTQFTVSESDILQGILLTH